MPEFSLRQNPPGLIRGVQPTNAGCRMKNSLLYDWLTVSFQTVDYRDLIQLLGLSSVNWSSEKTRLHYAQRLKFDGISIHFTEDYDTKHQAGCCLEMSGQGCRDFETFGIADWNLLFEFIALAGGNVTRLDIAYDDFTGVLPLRQMYDQADRYEFTTRKQKLLLTKSSDDAVPDHAGLSVCHGSQTVPSAHTHPMHDAQHVYHKHERKLPRT